MDRKLLTVEEVADLLRMSRSTVRRRYKELGGFRLPGCRPILFHRDRLEKLFTSAV